MRPNLMSPRRVSTSGEDSILALLEREPARKRKAGASGAQLAWYGAGATVVLALTGVLVWMAANNDGRRPALQEPTLAGAEQGRALAGADTTLPAMPTAGATVVQVAMAAPPQARQASAAVIVDQPPGGQDVPPLRLLKPAPETRAQDKPAAAPTQVPASAPRVAPAPPVARSTQPPRPVAAVPAEPKPLARTATAPTMPATAAKPARPAALAKNSTRPGQSKAQRSVNPGKSADGNVDADVALISAVIVHANGHAPADSHMTELICPNDNCQPRPPRQ